MTERILYAISLVISKRKDNIKILIALRNQRLKYRNLNRNSFLQHFFPSNFIFNLVSFHASQTFFKSLVKCFLKKSNRGHVLLAAQLYLMVFILHADDFHWIKDHTALDNQVLKTYQYVFDVAKSISLEGFCDIRTVY